MNFIAKTITAVILAAITTVAGAQSLTSGSELGNFSLGSRQASNNAPSNQSLDGIAAVVNNDVILKSRLARAVAQARQKTNRNVPLNALRSRVLDRLIMKKLQLQQAHKEGLSISKQQLQRGIKRVAKSNNMSVAQFKQAVKRQGLTFSKLEDRIRTQMLVAKLRRRTVMSKVQITPDDVSQYMRTQDLQQGIASAYRFRRIVINKTSSETTARKQLEQLRKRANTGADFATLAKNQSSGPNADQGGLVDWTPATKLDTKIASALDGLDTGDISPIVQNGQQLMLLKLLGRRPVGGNNQSATVTQVKAQHIVVKPNAIRTQTEAKKLANRLRQQIQAGNDFASIAKEHSDDKASASDGGELGWITMSRVSPQTRQALADLSPGDVSPVLNASSGFEIIKMQDRRTRDRAEQRRRNKARQALGKQRAREQGKVWQQKLRDRAYIDIRIKGYQQQQGT
ncbi:hypothetical protein HKX42_07215 [Salinisphaera sp. USBA-960]|uniref:peptidylprolyl isomerase n=1 Tax=Salinisphaera orenii TaxID=856731 RepID=UPI000DBE04AC|nr:hypothetical protein [Salifodinibacter halophilus]NNC26662.1 hypothetical protein [Salifodinibacter halophilus]